MCRFGCRGFSGSIKICFEFRVHAVCISITQNKILMEFGLQSFALRPPTISMSWEGEKEKFPHNFPFQIDRSDLHTVSEE